MKLLIFLLFIIINLVLGGGNNGSQEVESNLKVEGDKEFKVKIEKNWIQYKELNYVFAGVPNEQALHLEIHEVANSYDKRNGIFVGEEEFTHQTNEGKSADESGVKKTVSSLSYKFKIPNDWAQPQNELEMRIVLKRREKQHEHEQIILRRFKLHKVFDTLLNPEVEISILPEKLLTSFEEKEWQGNERKFLEKTFHRQNTLFSELEYVKFRTGLYIAQEATARGKMANAETAQERFEYAQAVRDSGWLYYHLIRYHAGIMSMLFTSKIAPMEIESKITALIKNVENYYATLFLWQKSYVDNLNNAEKGTKIMEQFAGRLPVYRKALEDQRDEIDLLLKRFSDLDMNYLRKKAQDAIVAQMSQMLPSQGIFPEEGKASPAVSNGIKGHMPNKQEKHRNVNTWLRANSTSFKPQPRRVVNVPVDNGTNNGRMPNRSTQWNMNKNGSALTKAQRARRVLNDNIQTMMNFETKQTYLQRQVTFG